MQLNRLLLYRVRYIVSGLDSKGLLDIPFHPVGLIREKYFGINGLDW